MSFTARQVAESYWRAEESRDVERVLAHFHEDATFHPVSGPLVGHAQISTFYDGMGDTYPGLEVRITDEISSGDDRAALQWEADLIDREGRRFPIAGANFVTIRGDKFSYVRAYFDPTSFPQPEEC